MSSNKPMTKTREILVQEYVKCLKEDRIPWQQGWNGQQPENLSTGRQYRGCNRLLLSFVASAKGYKDGGWMTYNQALEKGWHVVKGEKSVPIEYWSMYDKKRKQNIDIDEAVRRILGGRDKGDFLWRNRTFFVFNTDQLAQTIYIHKETGEEFTATQMEEMAKFKPGIRILFDKEDRPIPAKEKPEVNFSKNRFVDNLIRKLEVTLKEGGNSAFYTPAADSITLPPKQDFKSEYEYYATLLHEACHASGHVSRLNRDLSGGFGSIEYAKEELRAEIGSSMIMQDIGYEFKQGNMDNHKAYIQSWISILENDPKELFRAIADGETIADYMEVKGQFVSIQLADSYIEELIDYLEYYSDPESFFDESRKDVLYQAFIDDVPVKRIDQINDYSVVLYDGKMLPRFKYSPEQMSVLCENGKELTDNQFGLVLEPSWNREQMKEACTFLKKGATQSEFREHVCSETFKNITEKIKEELVYSNDDLVQ